MSGSVLFLLGFGVPTGAPAIEMITSASISPSGGLPIGGTFTAPPDFVFNGFLSDNPSNSSPGCFLGCAPGNVIFGGGASGSGGDVFGSFSRAGQPVPPCDPSGHGLFGSDCFVLDFGSFVFGPAVLPPFLGDPTPVVTGAFSIFMNIRIIPAATFPLDFREIFIGSGSTVYDVVWQPDTETWRLTHTEGRIPAVPEPTTLLFWGTGAAALGLRRWLRRRRSPEHEHAA